jgi:hypothetical protein
VESAGTAVALDAGTRSRFAAPINRRITMTRTAMTIMLALNTALMLLGMSPHMAHAQQVGKYKSNGAYANANGTDAGGCRYFYISVARGGTTAAPETYLYYDIYDSCTGTWSWGNGTIPNAAFKSGNKTMTLNFTGSTSGGFYAEGESLAIALTFTRDSSFTNTWSGHSRWEYYGHVVHHHGSGTQHSAALSGSIDGSAVQAYWATTGTGRDRYIEFDRGRD